MPQKYLPVTLFASVMCWCVQPAFPQDDPSAPASSAEKPAETPEEKPEEKPVARDRGPLPKDVTGLQLTAIEAYEAGDYLRFVQATMLLRKERPYEPQYMIGMVVGAARLDRPRTAYNYMHVMQQQGLTYDFNSTPDTESIRNTEVYGYINDLLIRAGEPGGEAKPAFRLAESARYPEAITWDPSRNRLLTATIDTGAVIAISEDGTAEELLRADEKNGLWAIHGIAVDAARSRLWLSSTHTPAFAGYRPEQVGRSALVELDLGTLEVLKRHEVSANSVPHMLGAVKVSPEGHVYVLDRAVPMIHWKAATATTLSPYVGNATMVSFRDMAMSDDGKRLYVADAARGILLFDLVAQSARTLAAPENLNLGGISGLMYHDRALFMVQNGIAPKRLTRLDLDEAGTAVAGMQTIAVALEAFSSPSFGTVHGDSLYYFAGSNAPGADTDADEPLVLKSPLKLEEDIVAAAQRKFQDEMARKQKKN